MNEPDEDLFPEPQEKPDWRRESKGIWAVRLPNGDAATVSYSDPMGSWRADVLRNGKKTTRSNKDFNKCVAWAQRELFPRPTAWDRIRAV